MMEEIENMFSLETVFKEIKRLKKIIYELDECYQALKNSSVVQDYLQRQSRHRVEGDWERRFLRMAPYFRRTSFYSNAACLTVATSLTWLIASSPILFSIPSERVITPEFVVIYGVFSVVFFKMSCYYTRQTLKAYDRLQALSDGCTGA
jgi:hypothetical protein